MKYLRALGIVPLAVSLCACGSSSHSPTQRLGAFEPAGAMAGGRWTHAAALLEDGRVLVFGGQTTGVVPSALADLFDPNTNKFTATDSMTCTDDTGGMKSLLLADGRVLSMGGHDDCTSLYNPDTGKFADGPENPLVEVVLALEPSGGLPARPRIANMALAQLDDGRVLIAGGDYMASGGGTLASAALYDPKTGKSMSAGSMATARAGASATRLPDGRVLIAGGFIFEKTGSTSLHSTDLGTAELFDPESGKFTPTGSMSAPRSGQTALLLPDGRVLMVGGAPAAELYDPRTGTFSKTSLTAKRDATVALLRDGRVLITGGTKDLDGQKRSIASAWIYDPTKDVLTPIGSMTSPRYGHTATLLPDGRVLIAGGFDMDGLAHRSPLASAELYVP